MFHSTTEFTKISKIMPQAYVRLVQQCFVLFMSFVVSYYSQQYGDEREWM